MWCQKVSMSSCTYQSHCVYRALFPWCHSSIQSLTLFLPSLPHSFLRHEGRSFLEDIPFRAECSMASHFLHIVWLWVSVFVTMYCRRKNRSIWVFAMSLCYLISGCGPTNIVGYGSHWLGLISNQILVGYFRNSIPSEFLEGR